MPDVSKNVIGVPEASYLRPLLYSLRDSRDDLELRVDIPAHLARALQQRTGNIRCAFLSPLDYARHGGDYCIVPNACVSSAASSGTIQLYINPDVRDIHTLAVDIRVTTEIILAKIILEEKFPNREASKQSMKFVPMLPDRAEMLDKADAALIVNFHPVRREEDGPFALDLVEEWTDMTGLPYVHGFWVGHDEEDMGGIVREILRSKEQGMTHLGQVGETIASTRDFAHEDISEYLSLFSYDFGEPEQESVSEFMKYAYFHTVLPDVPDLSFYEVGPLPAPTVN